MFRKILKISGIVFAALILLLFFVVLGFWISTSGMKLDEQKLRLNYEMTAFYDDAGSVIERSSAEACKFSEIRPETVSAFLAVEDRKFYEHHGVNYKRIVGAALRNIASLSFREGGSTISQQLIKNTHLSGEKTFRRKFAELRLTRELEKRYTKEEILELYLNSIYFGKCGCGIANASRGYYGKTPAELTLAEGASLAGIIRSPSLYSPYLHYEKFLSRRNLVLKLMFEQEMISQAEYEAAAAETPVLCDAQENKNLAYLNGALDECSAILRISEDQINNLNLRIYTNLNAELQKTLENISEKRILSAEYCANIEDGIVILENSTAAVKAFHSTSPLASERRRQPASAIKPLLVYGPALENGLIEPATLLEDKKETIGDFSPSNYHDKYYGTVSARFALAHSLNVPAVHLLSDLGVDRAMRYLERNGMQTDEASRHLASALGGFTEGMTLPELCCGYRTLAAGGVYRPFSFVRRIEDPNGKVLYDSEKTRTKGRESVRVFSEQTSFLLSDMLSECVRSGTAKNLRTLSIPLCAKTGTNGNEKGNRDAYTISYNKAYTVGCWVGSDTLFDNSVTGSTVPCLAVRDAWSALCSRPGAEPDRWGFSPPEGVYRLRIDGEILKKDRRFALADENAPPDEVITDYFRTKISERSDKYSHPAVQQFSVERRDDVLAGSFFGEKRFSYQVYDNSEGERTLLFTRDGEDEMIAFTTQPLHNRHRIEVVAVYREKGIEGTPLLSDEFIFPGNFVPDSEDQDPTEDPPEKSDDGTSYKEQPIPPDEPDPVSPDTDVNPGKSEEAPSEPEEPDSNDAWWW